MTQRLPSLPLLLETIQWERDRQLKHFDGLDSKAGRLKAALGALALAVLVFAVGIAYEGLEAELHGPGGTTTDSAPGSSATPAGP